MRPTQEKKIPLYLQEYDVYNAYCLLTSFQPETFEEAAKDDDWKKAIKTELKSHEELGTFDPAILPPGEKAIDLKWVFTIKGDGTKKARLVAKGFQQPVKFDEATYMLLFAGVQP
uniref:Reverse transcriptase Ty1/copia-type domain-containing protein n=1 Tax=Graphocephala atropunctata TaxID=36148 RepID=A0A1B6MM64_9HEMI